MEENKEKEVKKPSYEELEQIAIQLDKEVNAMYKNLQDANMKNAITRLSFLFKVIEFESSFSSEFVENCAKEIEESLTIPEVEKNEKG